MDFHLQIERGIIHQAVIFSDSLHPEMVELLAAKLKGRAYHKQDISAAIYEVAQDLPMVHAELVELAAWMEKQI